MTLLERLREQADRDAAEHCPEEIIDLQREAIAYIEGLERKSAQPVAQPYSEKLRKLVAWYDSGAENRDEFIRLVTDALEAKPVNQMLLEALKRIEGRAPIDDSNYTIASIGDIARAAIKAAEGA
jgi:hypothetical protein